MPESPRRSCDDASQPEGRASVRVVAVDLGATSGRVMVATVSVDPDVLELDEVHRFPNGAVRHEDGSLRWDIARIRREVLVGLRLAAASGRVDGIGIDSWAIDYGLLDADGELLGDPFSHRDSRTAGIAERVVAQLGADDGVRRDGAPAAAVQHALPARRRPRAGRAAAASRRDDAARPRPAGLLAHRQRRGRAHERVHHPVLRRPLARVVHVAAGEPRSPDADPAAAAQPGRRRRDPAAGGRGARSGSTRTCR